MSFAAQTKLMSITAETPELLQQLTGMSMNQESCAHAESLRNMESQAESSLHSRLNMRSKQRPACLFVSVASVWFGLHAVAPARMVH